MVAAITLAWSVPGSMSFEGTELCELQNKKSTRCVSIWLWKATSPFVHTVLQTASRENFVRQREELRTYLARTADDFICSWRNRLFPVPMQLLTRKSRRCLDMTLIRRGRRVNRLWLRSDWRGRPSKPCLRSLSRVRIYLQPFSRKAARCRRRIVGRLRNLRCWC